jgi:hypothetical protein
MTSYTSQSATAGNGNGAGGGGYVRYFLMYELKLHLSAIWSIYARKDWLTKVGCETTRCRLRTKWNDLKGNTFKFLCTKFTEGASIATESSVSAAVRVISTMAQKTLDRHTRCKPHSLHLQVKESRVRKHVVCNI